jgi:DNA mismatch endonuclease, patch repair protein
MSGKSLRARAPTPSSSQVRRVMQANCGGDTLPEQVLRSGLHKLGLRFRKHARPFANLRCDADIVLASQKICVFVDGCFWHGCPVHRKIPKTNSNWWKEKIQANIDRDCRNAEILAINGWRVIRVWEHDLEVTCAQQTVENIFRLIQFQNQVKPS